MFIKYFLKISLFTFLLVFCIKFIEYIFQTPILYSYINHCLFYFYIQSVIFSFLFEGIFINKLEAKTKYYISSALKFFPTIVFTLIILKKDPDRNVQSILTLFIIYLLFKAFEVCDILVKLHDRDFKNTK